MDYFAELADKVLTSGTLEKVPADVFAVEIRSHASTRDLDVLKGAPRDIRREVLADLLFNNPKLAIRASTIFGLPRFIDDLYQAARQEFSIAGSGNDALQASIAKAVGISWRTPRRLAGTFWALLKNSALRSKLFRKSRFKGLQRIRRSLQLRQLTLEEETKMRERLLVDPTATATVARLLEVAVPFSLVLDEELSHVSRSREKRLDGEELSRKRAIVERFHQEYITRHPASASSLPTVAFSCESKPIATATPKRNEARAVEASLMGLALSGGGIRSATFNLGVLQGLADASLLRQFDYLSTVSGGGYIGSWFSAWVRRDGIRYVETRLSPTVSPQPQAPEQAPISFLREYSNYLTPRTGMFSADTWAMVSTWIRNTVLNQVILVLLLASVMLLPHALVKLFSWHSTVRAREELVFTQEQKAKLAGPATHERNLLSDLFAAGSPGLRFFRWLTFTEGKAPYDVNLGCEPMKYEAPAFSTLSWWKLDPTDRRLLLTLVSLFLLAVMGFLLVARENLKSYTREWRNEAEKEDLTWLWKRRVALTAHHAWMVIPILLAAVSWAALLWWLAAYASTSATVVFLLSAFIYAVVLIFIQTFGHYFRCRLREVVFSRREWAYTVIGYIGGFGVTAVIFYFALRFNRVVKLSSISLMALQLLELGIAAAAFYYIFKWVVFPQLSRPAWGERRRRTVAYLVLFLASTLSAATGGCLTVGTLKVFRYFEAQPWHAVALGVPLAISVFSLMFVVHIGLLGEQLPDERREWWSRLGGWLLIYAFAWLALFVVAIYAPFCVHWFRRQDLKWANYTALLTWAGSTIAGLLNGSSRRTDGTAASATSESKQSAWREYVATVSPYIFVVGIMILIGCSVHELIVLAYGTSSSTRFFDELGLLPPGKAVALPIVLAFLTTVIAWRVDVNEFSMHHLYKNRLVRCYLGASRKPGERRPQRFTGFDADDDFPLSKMSDPGKYAGPLPIINTALNVVKGDRLAWQERKAISFAFTPIYSGYDYTGEPRASYRDTTAAAGYRLTKKYAYPADDGIKVGTAMAISGAAVNPNMGFHTSPAVAFLMTMFNVRLGWWLGNTRRNDSWRWSSPLVGLIYLFNELTSNTNDWSRFINLSDGGHFDNLGIYELVRRRCLLIVASDAEEDATSKFEGLANVIRKVRIDFGVEIEMDVKQVISCNRKCDAHYSLGVIHYPGGSKGILLYMKASLSGDEPVDILEYTKRVPEFPHETTADQWFDESQFESYRKLGYHVFKSSFDEESLAPPQRIESAPGKCAF